MQFVYYYKTSDNVRHEARMDAPSREEVFSILRKRGIRPIKVIGGDSSAPEIRVAGVRKRWVVAIAAVVAVVAATIGTLVDTRVGRSFAPSELSGEYGSATRETMLRLVTKARARKDKYDADLKLIDLDILHDYVRMVRSESPDEFYDEISKAREIIERVRMDIRTMFADLYSIFPPEAENERRDAQKLYGELMTDFDLEEDRINSDELIVSLLLSSREHWSVENGCIVFLDPKLEREFRFLRKDADVSVSRWYKDFGPKARDPKGKHPR